MHSLDDYGRAYLRLALEINKYVNGFVDAYIGPEDLKEEVNAADKKSPAALQEDLAVLHAHLPDDDPQRYAYLDAHLRAMFAMIRKIGGETFDYLDEVGMLYDIEPEPVDETQFLEARKELETLLPGSDPLPQRMSERRNYYNLPDEKVLPLLELARAEAHRRTTQLYDLPTHEKIEIQLTENQPWSAYNWFLGNGRSLIEFNTDLPISALGLISTFAHEGYPGHHTEAVLKESRLYQGKGYGEFGVMLLNSPAAVIAEGIATTAVEIIFPNDAWHEWTIDVLLPAAGIEPRENAEQMRRIVEAGNKLRHISGNAAILYHTGQLSKKKVIDYLLEYGLTTRDRAKQSFKFITHPIFASYVFTYTHGYDLIQQAVAGKQEKEKLYGRLLTEPIIPSQIDAL